MAEANLQEVNLTGINLQGADSCDARFDNLNLKEAKYDEIVINERRGNKEKDSKKKTFEHEEAFWIYHNLKSYFRNEGRYEKSGFYYYREESVEK